MKHTSQIHNIEVTYFLGTATKSFLKMGETYAQSFQLSIKLYTKTNFCCKYLLKK